MIEATLGIWIAEVADLASLSSAKIDHLKATLSRRIDGPTRMAYARYPITRARQFVVVGTTNDKQYLADPTGGRRFWPVRVARFDYLGIARDRNQLWAEAAVREAAGESIRLPEHLWPVAAAHQEQRREEDPWEDPLEAAFGAQFPGARVALDEPWSVLGCPVERRGKAEQRRVTRIMERLGYSKRNVRVEKEQKKCWVRADVAMGTEET